MAIIRDMPMEAYLASSNAGNHQLKDFSISPRLYFQKYVAHREVIEIDDDGDDDGESHGAAQTKESKARVFGIAFEMFMDEPREFDKKYIQVPLTDDEGKPFVAQNKYGIAWRKAQQAAGRIRLTAKEFSALREMKLAYEENADAVELMKHCERQVTLTCQWPPGGGVTIQSRPDYVSFKGCALSGFRPFTMDLKTVDKMPRMYSKRIMVDYGYDNQAEIARTCMRENEYAETVHYILACEKSTPNRCVVFELHPDFLDACSDWVFNNCIDMAECISSGIYPRSREPGIIVATKPEWKKAGEV